MSGFNEIGSRNWRLFRYPIPLLEVDTDYQKPIFEVDIDAIHTENSSHSSTSCVCVLHLFIRLKATFGFHESNRDFPSLRTTDRMCQSGHPCSKRPGQAVPEGRPDHHRLVDRFGRVGTDLRVSLKPTGCNLRCSYCMPPEGLDWLPDDTGPDRYRDHPPDHRCGAAAGSHGGPVHRR